MVFATEEDDQTLMMIHVLQGEREMAKDNISLGLFKLDGIPPAPRYEQEVEVTFKIDADGILNVSAEILETGRKKVIKVAEATQLSEEEITRRIIEATKFDEEDERRTELIKVRNRAEAVLYGARKLMAEINGKISEDEERNLQRTLESLKAVLNGGDIQKIKGHTDELIELMHGITTKVRTMSQAKMLVSSVEKKFGHRIPSEEKRKVEVAAKRLVEAPYKSARQEMDKLKEIITSLEVDHAEG